MSGGGFCLVKRFRCKSVIGGGKALVQAMAGGFAADGTVL
jgi:hypothetical protein